MQKKRAELDEQYIKQQANQKLNKRFSFEKTGIDHLDKRLEEEIDQLSTSDSPVQEILNKKDFPNVKFNDFDVAIFDEITELKNEQSKCNKCFRALNCVFKVGLTGTPIMNNMKELYNLVNFLYPGFLGSRRQFLAHYGTHISQSRLKDADDVSKMLGRICENNLHQALKKIMIRYTKEQLKALEVSKHEIVIWCNMSDLQQQCYENYINTTYYQHKFKRLENDKIIPFQLISQMRKTAEHCLKYNATERAKLRPELRSLITRLQGYYGIRIDDEIESSSDSFQQDTDQAVQHELEESSIANSNDHSDDIQDSNFDDKSNDDIIKTADDINADNKNRVNAKDLCNSNAYERQKAEMLISPSSKTEIMIDLLQSFKERNLKTIVFAEHTKALDLIQQQIILKVSSNILRIDGKVINIQERARIMDQFNKSEQFQILLMTIRAGGMGLNLQGAKRVIIYSPNWNPSIEEQAIGRAYRLGQTSDVYVYKLVVRNTIEEKLVARQFHKLQIANAATEDLNAKVKVCAADIIELLIVRTEQAKKDNDVYQKMKTIKPGDDFDGVEANLKKSFNIDEFLHQIDESEAQMIEKIQKIYYKYNIDCTLTIDDLCHYEEDKDNVTEKLHDGDIELLEQQIPSIEELQNNYDEKENLSDEEEADQNPYSNIDTLTTSAKSLQITQTMNRQILESARKQKQSQSYENNSQSTNKLDLNDEKNYLFTNNTQLEDDLPNVKKENNFQNNTNNSQNNQTAKLESQLMPNTTVKATYGSQQHNNYILNQSSNVMQDTSNSNISNSDSSQTVNEDELLQKNKLPQFFHVSQDLENQQLQQNNNLPIDKQINQMLYQKPSITNQNQIALRQQHSSNNNIRNNEKVQQNHTINNQQYQQIIDLSDSDDIYQRKYNAKNISTHTKQQLSSQHNIIDLD